MGLYRALAASIDGVLPQDGPALCGFKLGNHIQEGCLVDDVSVRLHSCERGTDCEALKQPNVVYITPVITRDVNGHNVQELGAGDGSGDLAQVPKLDLSITDSAMRLLKLCYERLADPTDLVKTTNLITKAMATSDKVLSLEYGGLPDDLDEMPLEEIIDLLQKTAELKDNFQSWQEATERADLNQVESSRSRSHIVSSMNRHVQTFLILADLSILSALLL